MDFKIQLDTFGDADIISTDGIPEMTGGIETAVYLSLFTERRASDGEILSDNTDDRHGWWGEQFDEAGAVMGSKLWLLGREKNTGDVVARARKYAEEALAWLVADQVAEKVTVTAQRVAATVVALEVTVMRGGKPLKLKYAYNWNAQGVA